jgi:hypothetical protein
VVLTLDVIYFHQLLGDAESTLSWMMSGRLVEREFGLAKSFSVLGLVAALLQLILSYWVATFVVKILRYIHDLHRFFRDEEFAVVLDTQLPDAEYGLEKLSGLATLQVSVVLLGGYISFKVIDKLYLQHASLTGDIGNPVMLINHVILAPLFTTCHSRCGTTVRLTGALDLV